MAAQNGHCGVVEILIENGAKIEAKIKKSYDRPLHLAAMAGHEEVLQCLIKNGSIVDSRDNDDYTPLHMAAQNGHYKAVECLIKNGAEIEAKVKKNHDRPLHLAAKEGHCEIVQLLIMNGAEIEAKLKDNLYTALHLSAILGHHDVVECLIENGAEIDARDLKNLSPVHYANKFGDHEIVKYLMNKKEENDTKSNFEEHNSKKIICRVCLEPPDASYILLGCGHMPFCSECSKHLLDTSNPKCPICRKNVKDRHRAFL